MTSRSVRTRGTRDPQSGIALILTLFLVLVGSVMAASLTMLAQSETYASLNYELMSQARYGAESGLQRAANYLINSYTAPGDGVDPMINYDTTVSPVTFNGNPVVLSANPDVASNYPIAAVRDAFEAAAQGTLTAGRSTVSYAPWATLISMKQVSTYAGAAFTLQVWRLESTGTLVSTGRTAQVEVESILERQTVPAYTYAAFATHAGCGALKFAGGAGTDSYNSAALVAGAPVFGPGGDVGTNGNLTESGGATINGSLSTPRVGVGNCSAGNVSALTSNGGATVTGGTVHLPQAVALPTPTAPNPLPPTTSTNYNVDTTLTPEGGPYGDIKFLAGSTLHLGAGTYVFNSLTLAGNSFLVVDSGPVIIQVAGQGSATPIDFTGGSVSNPGFDPSTLQLVYGGTGAVKLNGGASTAAVVYAPEAAVTFSGSGNFYGSVIGKTVTDTGGAQIHYDTSLQNKFVTAGNHMLTAFTWKKS